MNRSHTQPARTKSFRPHLEALEDRTLPALLAPVASPGQFTAVGDFNGDGKADLVVVDPTGGVSVRLGNGNGKFGSAGPVVVVASGEDARVGDFDGDGKRDVLLRTGLQLALLRGNGDGTLRPPIFSTVGLPGGTLASGALSELEAADMNNDGLPDVLVRQHAVIKDRTASGGKFKYDALQILLARTDGSFATTYNEPLSSQDTGPEGTSYFVGDFTGDGKADVLFVGKEHAPQIVPGRGNGTLDPTQAINHDWNNKELAVADLNGDGVMDVLQRKDDGDTWKVFLNNGHGVFTQTGKVTLPGIPVFADVNGDGITDIIAVDSAAGKSSVLLGKEGGNFKAARTFAVGTAPLNGPFVADFNGDGRTDLAVSNLNSVFVLFNDGNW